MKTIRANQCIQTKRNSLQSFDLNMQGFTECPEFALPATCNGLNALVCITSCFRFSLDLMTPFCHIAPVLQSFMCSMKAVLTDLVSPKGVLTLLSTWGYTLEEINVHPALECFLPNISQVSNKIYKICSPKQKNIPE